MSISTLSAHRKALAAVPAAGLAMLLLAGCGGGASAAASSADPANNAGNNAAAGNNTNGGNGGARSFPGANGKIAQIDGKTMQVQSDTTQTAVKYTDSTKLSQTVAGSRSDLAVGKCVSVRPVQSTDAAAAPTATDDSTPVAAGSVSITDPVNGSCTGGFGGGFGAGRGNGGPGNGNFAGRGQRGANGTNGQAANGQGTDGQAPQGAPNGGQNGQGFRGGMGARGVNGKITAIDGDTVTVEMQRPQFNQNNGAAASSTPTMTTVSRTATLSSSTTYTKTESASSGDLKVGKCVTALGSTDTDGTLTATSIALRPAENGSCTAAFGGRGNRNGAPAATTSS